MLFLLIKLFTTPALIWASTLRPVAGARSSRRASRRPSISGPASLFIAVQYGTPIRGIAAALVPARSRGVLLLLPRLRPQRPAFRLGGLPRPRPARLSPLRLPVHAGFLRTARSGLPQHRGPGGLPAASSRHPRNGGHAPGPTPVEASGPDVLRGPQRPHPDRACGRRGRAMERHSAHLPHHQLHPDPLRAPFLRGARRRADDQGTARGFSVTSCFITIIAVCLEPLGIASGYCIAALGALLTSILIMHCVNKRR